jgi:hypothetical protein
MAKQANVPVVPIVFENYFDLFNTKNHVFKAGNITIKGKKVLFIFETLSEN